MSDTEVGAVWGWEESRTGGGRGDVGDGEGRREVEVELLEREEGGL